MPLPPPVNTGAVPNDRQGDPLYVAFQKLNARDDYLLTQAGGWTGAVAAESLARAQGDADVIAQVPDIITAQLVQALEIVIPSLPTTLPASPNKLWNNGGILCIS